MLCVTALAENARAARQVAYEAIAQVHFAVLRDRQGKERDVAVKVLRENRFPARLGGVAVAISEETVALATLPAFPKDETDGLKLCAALAACVDAYNLALYDATDRANTMGLWVDVNDLSAIASAVEKLGWMLAATLEKA